MKTFYVRFNIGKSKYVVSHHDGAKKHPDGSDFFDVAIFKNKRELSKFVAKLYSDGYCDPTWQG